MESNNDIIHIALAANHAYSCGLQATMASMILYCSNKARLQFHILDDHLYDSDRQQLVSLAQQLGLVKPLIFHTMDLQAIMQRALAYNATYTTYMRLLLPEILPEVDWILYADVDTLWFADVCELWNLRNDNVSLMGCPDILSIAKDVAKYTQKWNSNFKPEAYFCAGVLLINLKRMRQNNFIQWAYDFMEKWSKYFFFADQEVLNAVDDNEKQLLPQHWDCMNPTPVARYKGVIHFNGIGVLWKNPQPYWRPLYAIWYRFYGHIISHEPYHLPLVRRLFFYFLGTFYPGSIIKFILKCFVSQYKSDQLCRQIFFAWLYRKAKWSYK